VRHALAVKPFSGNARSFSLPARLFAASLLVQALAAKAFRDIAVAELLRAKLLGDKAAAHLLAGKAFTTSLSPSGFPARRYRHRCRQTACPQGICGPRLSPKRLRRKASDIALPRSGLR
jgi:hypothetical protein